MQGHPATTGHGRKEDVGCVVLTDRFGDKTSAGGSPQQDIEVGGKTEECASTHTSCMEGIPIPAKPSIRYRIAMLPTPKEIEEILCKLKFKMLAYLGVNQHVKTEWRRLPREFGGAGLYNLSIEQFISWMEVLLQHYGAGFTTSKKLQASLEAMQLEIGCSGNPLNKDYSTFGPLAMEGWVVAVWERASHYDYNISLDYPTERLP